MFTSKRLTGIVATAAAILAATSANAGAIYGKTDEYLARVLPIADTVALSEIAGICHVRPMSDDAQSLLRLLERIAGNFWPNASDPVRQAAVMRAEHLMTIKIEAAHETMDAGDCQELKSNPAMLRRIDALRAEFRRYAPATVFFPAK